MGKIKEIFKSMYNSKAMKIRYSQLLVQDLETEEQQLEKVKEVHNFAHRNVKENSIQLMKKNYFPGMRKSI